MPWGTIFLGVMATALVYLAMPYFVTGTTGIEPMIRNVVTWGMAGFFGILVIVGMFKHS